MAKDDRIDQRPELKWIKLSQLYVPTEYQRPAKKGNSLKNIEYIKQHFNWASCGALIVCELKKAKPPQYAIIDGQHRYRAAEVRGDIPELPCVLISPREVREQAKHFVEVNSKRLKLHALHQYHAAIVAGEPTACMIDAILKKTKIDVPKHPIGNKLCPSRTTQAIGTLTKMIDSYSEKQIIWALTIISEAYDDTPGVLRASLIKTMAEWIKRHPDTNRDTMMTVLQDIDLDDLEKDALAYRAIEGKRMPEAFMAVIERKYNAAKKAVA
jgi:hypothetical protein